MEEKTNHENAADKFSKIKNDKSVIHQNIFSAKVMPGRYKELGDTAENEKKKGKKYE